MTTYLEKHYIDNTLEELKTSLTSLGNARDIIKLLSSEEKITSLYNNIANYEEVIY